MFVQESRLMDPVFDVCVGQPIIDPVLDVCVRAYHGPMYVWESLSWIPGPMAVLDVCVGEPIMDPVLDVCVREPSHGPSP